MPSSGKLRRVALVRTFTDTWCNIPEDGILRGLRYESATSINKTRTIMRPDIVCMKYVLLYVTHRFGSLAEEKSRAFEEKFLYIERNLRYDDSSSRRLLKIECNDCLEWRLLVYHAVALVRTEVSEELSASFKYWYYFVAFVGC
jgi:hypothetical protein